MPVFESLPFDPTYLRDMQENRSEWVANVVDIYHRHIFYGKVIVVGNRIDKVDVLGQEQSNQPYLLPGFIDAHIHIESSMLTPPAFARMAVRHGTVATVSDPHEIANVCGIEGVRFMTDLGKASGFTFCFGAPSCVPATPFETAGATLTREEILTLFEEKRVGYLSEMMNYPAVWARDPLVMDKIAVAQAFGLPVDGHAPGVRGEKARLYASAGITTDHECFTLEEALDKIDAGMRIIIREGSAARNYKALHTLLDTHPDKVMLCSDDKHPDDLLRGHINELVCRALADGHDLFHVLRAACLHPIEHYHLPTGTLRQGDRADMILVDNLKSFHVLKTWIDGRQVFDGHHVDLPAVDIPVINQFNREPLTPDDFHLSLEEKPANIIVAIDGAIVTEHIRRPMPAGQFESDMHRDILKIAVINRYDQAPVAIGLIRGFGFQRGAIASSVAHDSHNIVAVGTSDEALCSAVNQIIAARGGIAASSGHEVELLALPIAGLMSPEDAVTVGKAYEQIDHFVKTKLDCPLHAPFMTLSFMALLVIPTLKMSDQGLFDGEAFQFQQIQE